MTTPSRSRTRSLRLPALAYATAVVTLVADILLMLTYVLEVSTDGPYQFGTAHRAFAAVSNVLIALVVLRVSPIAEKSGVARFIAGGTAAASLVGAGAAVLGIPEILDFALSSVIAAAVLVVQGVWMFWFNTLLREHGVLSRALSQGGRIIGAGLIIGIVLVAGSVFLPTLTIPHLIVLGAGVFIGGGQWLAWPVWFVILGWQLRKGPKALRPAAKRSSASSK